MNFIELYFDTPKPEKDTTAEYHANLRKMRVITPDEVVTNVLKALVQLVDAPPHQYRMDAIRDTAHQLAERWETYQRWINGEDVPLVVDDDLPF